MILRCVSSHLSCMQQTETDRPIAGVLQPCDGDGKPGVRQDRAPLRQAGLLRAPDRRQGRIGRAPRQHPPRAGVTYLLTLEYGHHRLVCAVARRRGKAASRSRKAQWQGSKPQWQGSAVLRRISLPDRSRHVTACVVHMPCHRLSTASLPTAKYGIDGILDHRCL